MSFKAGQEYIRRVWRRYQDGDRSEKKKILDELCSTWGYSRKYAIRALARAALTRETNGAGPGRELVLCRGPGRRRQYEEGFARELAALWQLMNQMCSKNMKAALPIWLPYYKSPSCTDEIRTQLLQVSPATMDRLLAPTRAAATPHGLSTTRPACWIKNKIPIELLHATVEQPGFIEADTVGHCGNTAAGTFAHSITMTDLWSGWTENRACLGKQADAVVTEIRSIERSLPFPILGFASDNGTEFLNQELYRYLTQRTHCPIKFVRRRPYKKNDAAHVEQKNFTHVRQLFGYERIEDPQVVALMNEIYREYWNPLLNYFTPTLKLAEKTRVGSQIKKKYAPPQTPVARLLESDFVNPAIKRMLIERRNLLNPIQLKQALDKKLKMFFELAELTLNRAA